MSEQGAKAILKAELKRKLDVAIDGGNMDRAYEILHEIQEFVSKAEVEAEIAEALAVLDKHLVMYKVWGEVDVMQLVDQLPGIQPENAVKIMRHVIEGDDWKLVGEAVEEASQQKIWEIVSGTASDHPEWFTEEALRKL
jgi:hypothetical protein